MLAETVATFGRESMMKIDGQCHCGRVSYRADIDPERVSICHCTDCQQLTGSPYRVTVLCARGQIEMTGADPQNLREGRRQWPHPFSAFLFRVRISGFYVRG
jgi:hypothetical protein